MKLTREQYDEILKRPAFKRRNPDCGEAQGAQPECPVRDEQVETPGREEGHPSRSIVRITSFRCKLLDKDNLYGGVKFFVDSLRYSKLIADDSTKDIELEVAQEKVKTKAEERTEIRIWKHTPQ